MMKIKEFFLSMVYFTSGCTEPAAIALNAAHASEALQGMKIKSIILQMDYLTYKNAFNAGIPNAPLHKGAMWAYIFGLVIGDKSLELEIFSRLEQNIIEKAGKIEANIPFRIKFVERGSLYLKSIIFTDRSVICTITSESHNSVKQSIYDLMDFGNSDLESVVMKLDELEHIEYSKKIKEETLFNNEYYAPEIWLDLIEELYSDSEVVNIVKEGIEANLIAQTEGQKDWDTVRTDLGTGSAIYARMSGKPIRVLACANSGNKGLTSIVPTVNYCMNRGLREEDTIKAVTLACFVNSIITIKFGFISSICGVVYGAGAGFLAAMMMIDNQLTSYDKVFINYISSFGGIFCDGAKVSCAIKGNTAIQAAFTAKDMFDKGLIVDYQDGYLGKSFNDTLENLMKYNDAMREMDKITVSILDNKKK